MLTDSERQSRERAFWDRFAAKYDPFLKGLRGAYQIAYREIQRYCGESKTVLEIGTGSGVIALQVAPLVNEVHACDISPEMIAVARRNLENSDIHNVAFSVQDAYNLEYPPQTFDLAVASNVLHIMISPENALASIHRVLKTGGVLIAPTYCHGTSILSRTVSAVMSLKGFRAFHKWSPKTFEAFLETHGFTITHRRRIGRVVPFVIAVAAKRKAGPVE
jgi:ubiquinone/menaquinone biosynthesis C-methylase UbiE